MIEFYYGTTWIWPIQYLPRVMISASFLRNRKSKLKIEKPWMMDSGIGGMFKDNSSPRLSVEEYVNIILLHEPPIAWTYDYPCEPSIVAKYCYTVSKAQDMTNKNTAILRDYYGLKNVMSVVQGWDLNDYLENIDKIKSAGLLTERLGIGSICRRGQTKEITRIIKAIHNSLPEWVKLHGFGAKTSVLKTEARFLLDSADSSAWDIERRHYSWSTNGNKGLVWQDKVPYLLDYINKVEELIKDRITFETFELEG